MSVPDMSVNVAAVPDNAPPDKKVEQTIAALEQAVEYYTRVLMNRTPVDEEEEKRFKPVPPLKDLEQLVQYRLIKAVPAGPNGKKYVYDAQTGKVKLQ